MNHRRARAAVAAAAGLLAGLVLTAGADVYASHGWAATWWVTPSEFPRVTHVTRSSTVLPLRVHPSNMPTPDRPPELPQQRPSVFPRHPTSPLPIVAPEADVPDSGVRLLPTIPPPEEPRLPVAPIHGDLRQQVHVQQQAQQRVLPGLGRPPLAQPPPQPPAPLLAGPRRVLARTIERRVVFPNDMRVTSRYLQHWDFDRLGVPDHLPDVDATFDAWLRIDRPRQVRVDAHPPATLYVDGHRAGDVPLGPGAHRIRVAWKGPVDRGAYLELEWDADGTPHAVPARALTPVGSRWQPVRIALVVGGVIFSLLLGAALGWIALAPPVSRRRALVVLVAALAIGYGGFLRTFDYDVAPDYRENADELFAEWNGWSLLTEGRPRGWSLWPEGYDSTIRREELPYFAHDPFTVISPYFEHPPLLHLIVGVVAKVSGAKDWPHVRLMYTRLVPIGLQVVSLWLLLLVARRFFPRGPAPFFAVLLYAVIPFIALQGRVIKEEALLIPLSLAGLYFFLRWRDDGRATKHLVYASVAMAACTLAKMTGAVMPVALVLLVMREKRAKSVGVVVVVTACVVLLLLAYAAAIDLPEWWWATLRQASGRPSHFNIFPRWFDDAMVNHQLIGRGWLLYLWLAGLLAVPRLPRGHALAIVVPLFVYLLAISVSSGNWTFGWYATPLHPFLCLLAGRTLADTWEEPDLLRGSLLGTLLVMYSLNFFVDPSWAMSPAGMPLLRPVVSAVVAILVGPFVLATAFPGRRMRWLCRATIALGLVAFVAGATALVLRYDVDYYAYQNFDRLVFFDR